MDTSRRLTCVCVVLTVLCPSVCAAWLYDAGIAQYAGEIIKQGTAASVVAAPFVLSQDAYATSFGAALGRAYGPVGAGFTVVLCPWTFNVGPGTPIDTWTVTPTVVALTYYYFAPTSPLRLVGGAPYALLFTPSDPDFAGAISYSNKPGTYYGWKSAGEGQPWYVMYWPVCIRVDGYVVPEPGLALPAGLAMLALFILRLRKPWRQAVNSSVCRCQRL